MANGKCSPELLDTSQWPSVSTDMLEAEELIRYKKLEGAVRAACNGVKSGEIFKRFGVSASLLNYHLKKCTSTSSDGRLMGFRALLINSERAIYTSTTEQRKCTRDGAGYAGAFRQLLLRFSKTATWLSSHLKPAGESDIRPAGLNIASLHQDFLTQLKKEGCTIDEYPFTVKRYGYEALVAYINRRIDEGDTDLAVLKFGESASQAPGRNSGELALLRPLISFERVAYDEYQLPNIATITITDDGKDFEIPIRRGYFCPIVDFNSEAVLGFSFSIAERFTSANLTKAFENSIKPPPQRHNVIFEDLPELLGQGVPALVVPNAKGRRICILCLDNHLTHFSGSVVTDLRKSTGVAITFGKVRSWIERNVVERIFSWLQVRLSKIASTTGSGPNDPKVNDPVGNAIKQRINISELIALIEKLVARHNAIRRRALFGATPNERIARDWSGSARLQILPLYQESFVADPNIAVESVWSTIRGNRAKHRTPYIQLDNVPYTNDILRQSWSLIGKKLLVKIRGDYRTVLAFREDGSEFGRLSVSGAWALHPHTKQIRREINKLIREGSFESRCSDPVLFYQEKLAEKALKKTRRKGTPNIIKESNLLAHTLEASSDNSQGGNLQFKTKSGILVNVTPLRSRNRRSFFSPPEK